jgi:hypothetical protein
MVEHLRRSIEQLDEIELIIKQEMNLFGVNEKKHILNEIKLVSTLVCYVLDNYNMIRSENYSYITDLTNHLLDDINTNIQCQKIP